MPRQFLSFVLAAAALATAVAAPAQTVGPQPTADSAPVVPASPPAPGRREIGVVYGLAAFTEHHADVVWYDGAPVGADMDLETAPTLGLRAAWGAGENFRLGLDVTREWTRLVLGAGEDRTRTDLNLLDLRLEVERTFGGGRLRPLLAVAGGGVRVWPDGGAGATWHYTAAPALGMRFLPSPRVALRILARAPLIWANGTLVARAELAAGAALLF